MEKSLTKKFAAEGQADRIKNVTLRRQTKGEASRRLSTTGPNSSKANCPTCGKRVKNAGLADHIKAAHGGKA